MPLKDAFIYRIVGSVSPSWRVRLLWAQGKAGRNGKVVDAIVGSGDIAVDVGANMGLYTDRLAQLVGSKGRVFAFEPHPAHAQALTRIAATRQNVTLVKSAVSSQVTSARLSVPMTHGQANPAMASLEVRSSASGAETVTVATTTLDGELADVVGVRFIKCDVEGHEHDVLTGGVTVLERDHPVLLVEIEQRHRQRPIAETFDFLRELRYDGYTLSSAGVRPLPTFDVERDQLSIIADDPGTDAPPAGYVSDFLFLPKGTPVPV